MTDEISSLPERPLSFEEVEAFTTSDKILGAEPRRMCLCCGVKAIDVFLVDRLARLEYTDGRWVKVR